MTATSRPVSSLGGPAAGRGVEVSFALRSPGDVLESRFVDLISRQGLRHSRWDQYAVANPAAQSVQKIGGTVLGSRRTGYGHWCLIALDEGVAGLFLFKRGTASVELAGDVPEALDRAHVSICDLIGAQEDREGRVPITFWAMGARGPHSARRSIEAPSWSDIAANYAQSTSLGVAKLISSKLPDAGRLVLWHGEPGTGKTNALRSLALVWSEWCSTHFITDPEVFLGSGSSYLLDVLTSESRSVGEDAPDWKLVVLEDSGELLTSDAHERAGQALSRLLNTTDGLLGQGMKVIVLVTTNEPLRKLHPAIQRPGRCWHQVEFLPLRAQEADLWLAAHDSAMRVTSPTAIADLYAVLRGQEPTVRRALGFSARN